MPANEESMNVVTTLNDTGISFNYHNAAQVSAYWGLRAEACARVDADAAKTASKNISRSYKCYQTTFLEFCRTHFTETETPERVTGEKLLIYLVYRVDQGIIKKVKTRQKKAGTAEEYEIKESNEKFPIKYATLDTITSAILKLYDEQVSTFMRNVDGGQPWAHPRTKAVKAFLRAQQQMININNAANNLKDSDITSTYTEKDFIELIGSALEKSTPRKSYVSAACALTLFQALLFKGDSGRELDLSDIRVNMNCTNLYNQARSLTANEQNIQPVKYGSLLTATHIEAKNNLQEGRPSSLLFFICRKNKTNKINNQATVGSFRHVSVFCCSHFWLSAYLVERFHVNMEDPLIFDEREDFFKVKLFTNFNSSSDRNEKHNYWSQYQDIKNLMKHLGVLTDHVTHAPRAAGAQVCDSAGVSAVDIEKFGMCGTGQISSSLLGSYIHNIPVGPMAALCGAFLDHAQWKYRMPRDFLTPKKELKNQIFPFINDILEKKEHEQDHTQFDDSDKYALNTKQMSITLCTVFDYLRTVFIQDYKFMQESFPENVLNNNPIFKLGIFRSQEYADFRAEQDAVYAEYVERENNPREAWKKNPEVSSAIQSLSEEIHKSNSHFQNFQATVNQRLDSIEGTVSTLRNEVRESNSRNSGIQDRAVVQESSRRDVISTTGTLAPSSRLTFDFCKAPNFKKMWKEYSVTTKNKTCIKELEEKHGREWRREKRINKMYQRRKVIFDAIERGIAKKYTVNECLELLENALKIHKVNRTEFMDRNLIPDELK